MRGSYKTIMAVSLLMLAAFAVFGCIYAEDAEALPGTEFSEDNMKYKVNSDGTTVTLVGHENADGDVYSLNVSTATYLKTTYAVTIIGSESFSGCYNLGVLTISNNVKHIGSGAFSGCTALSVVTIPESMVAINSGAFSGCTSIRTVSIPSTVTGISTDAFSGCSFFKTDGSSPILDMTGIIGHRFQGVSCSNLVMENKHYVNYDLDGGSGFVEGQWVDDGKSILVSTYSGTKTTYEFKGWTTDGKDSYYPGSVYPEVTSGTTFKAVWTSLPTYTMSFDLNGGTGITPESKKLITGAEFNLPQCSATMAGYEFGGWNDGSKKYNAGATYVVKSSNVTFKAVWTAIPYRSVTYELDGGSGDTPDEMSVMQGTMIRLAEYDGTKEGYSFGGWSEKSGTEPYAPGYLYTVNTSVKFTAVWNEIPTHVVSYDEDGGSKHINPVLIQENTNFFILDYDGVKDGYVYEGWTDGKNFYKPGELYLMKESDISFKAVWSVKDNSSGSLIWIIVFALAVILALFVILRVLPRYR